MNKKFIVCEGLRVRLNLVFSLVFSLSPPPPPSHYPPRRVDLSVPVQFNRL